jgi:hypothetical protein
MHKAPIPIALDIQPPRHKRSVLRSAAILFLGIALAPIIADGTSLCYAQWCQVMGRNVEARTPVFDSLHDGLESGHRSVGTTISSFFQGIPWSPKIVLLVGVIVMVVGMMMLKL